jgi:hypothetical protein
MINTTFNIPATTIFHYYVTALWKISYYFVCTCTYDVCCYIEPVAAVEKFVLTQRHLNPEPGSASTNDTMPEEKVA